jgi:hypothetical protein
MGKFFNDLLTQRTAIEMKKLVVWLHALQFILDGKKHEFVEASSQQSITRRPQNEIKTKQNAM